ncbi:MAG: ATP-binding protein [Bacteroides sp. SM23_62_1]|nr:MAG: ATP-binding protein [Bacteroides sp. SM23_62_1]
MNEETLHKMKQMKFFGMARAFRASLEDGRMAKLTSDEMLSMLVESEWDDRNNRRIERNVRNAKFRYKANLEQLYFDVNRNVDRNQMMRLGECTFIGRHENLLITGSTGIGKSYIASAIGNQACVLGYKVFYVNTSKLLSRLKMAKADGSYIKEIARIEKQDLLILDDFGLQPFDNIGRAILMEIIEDRHGKRSTIITSQVPVSHWYDLIGEQTIADAILDRIVHDAYRLELVGESLRRRNKSKFLEEIETEK